MSRGSVRVVALLAVYNEADVIAQSIEHLVSQGVSVYVIDNGSTDETATIAQRYLGRGVLQVERLANDQIGYGEGDFPWERILQRKEEVALEYEAVWVIHQDADEFRESPWWGVTLRDAIERVDRFGYNAIDFEVLDFQPVNDDFRPGDPIETLQYWKPAQSFDTIQVNCWKQTRERVDLASKGGHDVQFEGRRVFPIRFVLRHYPIRSQAHGERKVFAERKSRFLAAERARGWHIQYDHVAARHQFIHDSSTLLRYDPDAIRLAVQIRHRDLERVEWQIGDVASQLAETTRRFLDAEGRLEEADRRRVDAERQVEEIEQRLAEAERSVQDLRRGEADLRSQVEAATTLAESMRQELESVRRDRDQIASHRARLQRRVDDLVASASWRLTAPLRVLWSLVFRTR